VTEYAASPSITLYGKGERPKANRASTLPAVAKRAVSDHRLRNAIGMLASRPRPTLSGHRGEANGRMAKVDDTIPTSATSLSSASHRWRVLRPPSNRGREAVESSVDIDPTVASECFERISLRYQERVVLRI
jgi:hypothetical protein